LSSHNYHLSFNVAHKSKAHGFRSGKQEGQNFLLIILALHTLSKECTECLWCDLLQCSAQNVWTRVKIDIRIHATLV